MSGEKKSSFLARFFKSKKTKKLEVQEAIQKASQEALKINKRLEQFETTSYQDRCMYCGGSSVFTYNLPSCGLDKVERMNIRHSCGGQLLISMAGWVNFASGTKLPNIGYSENGMILYDERK
ncbi:MAG: hypothetical protein KAG93_07225 [Desulfuromusa sp.]|nr:hypothetical protein [Desulfuromusa sp.]